MTLTLRQAERLRILQSNVETHNSAEWTEYQKLCRYEDGSLICLFVRSSQRDIWSERTSRPDDLNIDIAYWLALGYEIRINPKGDF